MATKTKKRKQKGVTQSIASRINDLFRRFRDGEIGTEEFVEAVLKEGHRVWNGFVAEFKRKFHPHADNLDDELWQLIRETIWETAVRGRSDGNYFSYLRLYVRGNLYMFARERMFPFVLKVFPYNLEVEVIPIDDVADPSSDYEEEVDGTGEGIPASDVPDFRPLSEFEEIELRDLIEKTLEDGDTKIAYMLMDGYTIHEIAKTLGVPVPEVEKRIENIRLKLSSALRSLD